MKLGLVGPAESVSQIERIITQNFPYIQLFPLVYETYRDSADLVRRRQAGLDSLLFSGPTPFKYASRFVVPAIPWDFIPREKASLLTVLTEASALHHYDIAKISIDSVDYGALMETFQGIGLPEATLQIQVAEEKIFDDDYSGYLAEFHKQAFRNDKVSFCITGMSDVQKALTDEQIPCFKMKRMPDVIKNIVTKLKLKHELRINQKNQIVVLAVEVDPPGENTLVAHDDYQMAVNKMRASEQIYLFARKIQAAVIELSLGNYLLFTLRKILETETSQMSHFDFIYSSSRRTDSTFSVGIGFGKTAVEAKSGACMGKDRAQKCGGNRIFVVDEGEKIIGPISFLNKEDQPENDPDGLIANIAAKSGLGKKTVYKLFSLIQQYNLDVVTPAALAGIYGVTPRSINRILVLLEQCGYAKVVGVKTPTDSGRPSRLIKLLF